MFESVRTELRHRGSQHRRREVYVGVPTVYTIWGNKTGVDSQPSDADKRPDRPDNLFEPPPGDPGAHSPYDEQAHPRSLQLAATKHRRAITGAAAAAVVAAGAAAVTRTP